MQIKHLMPVLSAKLPGAWGVPGIPVLLKGWRSLRMLPHPQRSDIPWGVNSAYLRTIQVSEYFNYTILETL